MSKKLNIAVIESINYNYLLTRKDLVTNPQSLGLYKTVGNEQWISLIRVRKKHAYMQ